ncbi:SMC-Scp complex subunit ScpB [Lysobacter auxotrophicus]|uniref:SMC-Scp complex subunit ScpB n=1 Tax=Lysobacter auxotrophicus TaxID=2992573 RepID=A0ABM8DCD5_9GAMM|nr:SMC-Scp complex subunit ScpB [Lysobacter auxotrophicus]BDU16238.1 SMC-Scp complex subunit ScpB [Lysobacter auxotrophicus]
MDQQLITRIVEAALLAANQPLTLAQLHALFPEDQPAPPDSVEQALETLRAGCEDRGVELVEVSSGFRFQVKADVHPWVARLWTERQTRYTRATLETLALIAYRQPITRGEIEQVRGVAVNSNIIKALEEREWIRVVGHRDVPGKPALFGTTKVFLDYFGLKRLDELPPLSELKDIGELEPQLQFEGTPAPIAAGVGDGAPNAEASDADADGSGADDAAANEADGGSEADASNETGAPQGDQPEAETDLETATAENVAGANDDAASDETGADADVTAADEAIGSDTPDTIDAEVADLDLDENEYALQGEPEAAPGERAADENDHEQDNAVETTTVPTDDEAETAESEQHKND